jgi:competence protein ComEC
METTQQSLGVVSARPAIPVAAAIVLGILLHPLAPHRPILLIAVIAVLAIAAIFTLSKSYVCSLLLLIALILCGIGIAQREHFQFSHSDVGIFSSDEPHLAEVELRLLDEPRVIESSIGQIRHLPPKQLLSTEVLRVKTKTGWIDAVGELPVSANVANPDLKAGQTVRAFGMLERPSPADNPGQFDWAAYYRDQRILSSLTVNRLGNITILNEPRFSPLIWLRSKTRDLLARGFTTEHEVDHAILAALLLGDRDPQLRSVQDEFEKTGVAYQIAVSGLHVAMLGGFVLLLGRLLRLHPRSSLLIAELFVLLYATVSLPTHSGMRSVILCSAFFLAKWTHRSTERFQMLAVCVIAMLLYHPLDLYSLGFQLSFAAVLGLALFWPKWRGLVMVLQDPHTMLAPKPEAVAATRRLAAWVRDIAGMTVVAWIFILPLILYHIGKISPWSIVGSVVVLPIVLTALMLGLFKVIFTAILPIAAGSWAALAGVPIIALRHVVGGLAELPGGQIAMPAPPIWLIIVYYVLLLVPLMPPLPGFTGRRRWCLRLAPLAGVIAILFLPSFPRLVHPTQGSDDLRVTLLALGAGQCAVIEPPGGSPILFDAGSDSISDLVGKVVAPFLRTQGERRVDEIFLSHGDYDHISAAGEIATDYSVHDFFISNHFRRNAVGNMPDQQLLETMDHLHLVPRIVQIGNHFDLPGGARIDVLWPPPDGDWNSNNAGLVLRLSYSGRTILFPADIQDPAFEGLLKHPEQLRADILIAAHHGSSEELTPQFLHAVSPRFIVSSNAWRLTNKQKRFDVMVGDIPLYRTSKYGAITITLSKDGAISLTTFLHPGAPDVHQGLLGAEAAVEVR